MCCVLASSGSGKRILQLGNDHPAAILDAQTGKELKRLRGKTSTVYSSAFLPDSRFVMIDNHDSSVSVWKWESLQEICQFISFPDDYWVVVNPADGRFDSNKLEGVQSLSWVMPDDPVRAQPLEIFMWDYYEAQLLPCLNPPALLIALFSIQEFIRSQTACDTKAKGIPTKCLVNRPCAL